MYIYSSSLSMKLSMAAETCVPPKALNLSSLILLRRQGGNSLDLNNLPEDNYTRNYGKQKSWDTSLSAGGRHRKKKNGEGDGKVYECRFCSLKFCKSQALGGHMNRHRQERETETRQLVFTNDLSPVHLGYVSNGEPIPSNRVYHHQTRQDHHHMKNGAMRPGPPTPPQLLRPICSPPRSFSASPLISSSPPPQPQAVFRNRPPPSHHLFTFQTAKQPANKYFVGHALSYAPNEMCNNYTCIGTPVFGLGTKNTAVRDREEWLNCGRRS